MRVLTITADAQGYNIQEAGSLDDFPRRYDSLREAIGYALAWSDQMLAHCRTCEIILLDAAGEINPAPSRMPVVAPLPRCWRGKEEQARVLAEEFLGYVQGDQVCFSRREHAQAFAEATGLECT